MKYIYLIAFLCVPCAIQAQDIAELQPATAAHPITYSLRGGFNIGGSAPLSLPASIRAIESYSPGLMPKIAIEAHYKMQPKFGIAAGLMVEQKGMSTKAVVKNYYTTFNSGDENNSQSVTGYFTGSVTTKVRNTYLTVPVHATCDIGRHCRLKAGLFASVLLTGKFSGAASDGYMRDETPVGQKIGIANARYDFADQVSKLNAGLDIGFDYFIQQHFLVSASFSYGATPVMKKDFESVDFKMYNVFLGLSVGYRL